MDVLLRVLHELLEGKGFFLKSEKINQFLAVIFIYQDFFAFLIAQIIRQVFLNQFHGVIQSTRYNIQFGFGQGIN